MAITDEEYNRYLPSAQSLKRVSWSSIVFLLTGVLFIPVWWKVTDVYRAYLPVDEIRTLFTHKPVVTSQVHIICFDSWLDPSDLTSLEYSLMEPLEAHGMSPERSVQLHYIVKVRSATTEEGETMRTSLDLAELESGLSTSKTMHERDAMYFFLLPNNTHLLSANSKGIVRNNGLVYIRSCQSIPEIKDKIERVVTRILLETTALEESYKSSLMLDPSHQSSKETLRQASSSDSYDIVFTLFIPKPDVNSPIMWNIEEGIRLYLDPMLSRMSRFISTSVKSQIIYHVDFEHRPTFNSNDKFYYYEQKTLPNLINSVESYLTSPVSSSEVLNFVIYIPPAEISPLHIVQGNDKTRAPIDAFLTSRWGGVYFYNNLPTNQLLAGQSVMLDMRDIMSVFIAQARVLLGIKRSVPRIYLPVQSPDITQFGQWELNTWLRRRTLENIGKTKITLLSLVRLVDKVVNMVITEEVAKDIQSAVDNLDMTFRNLRVGGVSEAFYTSKVALKKAESAFFDPTLLERLYFPEDQKYAIYVPYFLPVGLSVVMSGFQGIKYFRNVKKAALDSTKKTN